MGALQHIGRRVAVVVTAAAMLVAAGALPAHAAPPHKISIGDVTVWEGDAGSTNATFTISYEGPYRSSTVNWAAANQTATAGSDYTVSSGSANLPASVCRCTTVNVPVLGDLVDEPDETFVVTLSSPSRGTLVDPQGVGTIQDDDGPPPISVDDASADEDGGWLPLAVTLAHATADTVTVDYATSDGTAASGSDYTSASGTLTFVPGDVSETVDVALLDDTLDEPDETLTLTLSNPVNGTIADVSAVGTILDEDLPPTLAVGDASAPEGDAGTATASFTVTLSKAHPSTITVDYSTANDSATAGADYTAAASTVTFTAGDTTETVDVDVLADLLAEDDETFDLVLSSPTSGIAITDRTGIGTVLDDDPNPALSIDDASVSEGGSVGFSVSLDAPAGRTVTVGYATAGGSALAGTDFAGASGIVTFAAGDTQETVAVSTIQDATYEPDEDFSVTLSGATNATIADGAGVGTILNDDAPPAFSVSDIAVNEDDGTATFIVTKSGATALSASVDVTTVDGTATAVSDYVPHTDSLTFAPGVSAIEVEVTLVDDGVHDGTETFTLQLSNPVEATIADASGTATITDDETPPTISIDDVVTVEGDAGATTAAFTLSLSGATVAAATVDYTVVAGSASLGSDVEAANGSATVLVGETTATIEVDIQGDVVYEGDETYTVQLSSPFNVAVTDGVGAGVITDDDPMPSIAIDDVTVTEGSGGTTAATFTVTRTGATELPIAFDVATADDTAMAGADYQSLIGSRTLLASVASRTVTVNVVGDTADEAVETFLLAIANPVDATISDADALGTIIDDDKALSSLSLLARKTATKVQARGILEPASGTSKVQVLLQAKVGKRWKTVAKKRVGVTQLRDRDADGYIDAVYRATLKRPSPGKYRFLTKVRGTTDTTAAVSTRAFRV